MLASTDENRFSNTLAGKPAARVPVEKNRRAFGDLTNQTKLASNSLKGDSDLTSKVTAFVPSVPTAGVSQRSNSSTNLLGPSKIPVLGPRVHTDVKDPVLVRSQSVSNTTQSQVQSKPPLMPQAHGIGLTRQPQKSVALAESRPAPVPVGDSNHVADMDVEMDEVPESDMSVPVAEMQPVESTAPSVFHFPQVPGSTPDVRDPFMTARPKWPEEEYLPMVWEHLKRSEITKQVSANYMNLQTDLNTRMREILIDWMIDVHLSFDLHQETLFLSLNILDRYLAKVPVSRTKLQLVGCTALFIASKYEEMRTPEVKDFAYMTDNAYTTDQILDMEKNILASLEFHITVPSYLRFMEIYFVPFLKNGDSQQELGHLANFMLELSLPYYFMVKYLPSHAAAAALYLAWRFKGNTWDDTMKRQTRFTEEELIPCATEMYAAYVKHPSSKYQAAKRKYSSSAYARIARAKLPSLPGL